MLLEGGQQGVARRLDGEEHVGAGVAVGHRVDVERVDLLAGRGQAFHREVGEPAYDVEVEGGNLCLLHASYSLGGRVVEGITVVALRPRFAPSHGSELFSCGCPDRLTGRSPDPCTIPDTIQVLPEECTVAAVCDICAKKPGFGNNRPWSRKITKRRFNPNIQRVRATVNGAPKRLNVCTGCLKAGKVSR